MTSKLNPNHTRAFARIVILAIWFAAWTLAAYFAFPQFRATETHRPPTHAECEAIPGACQGYDGKEDSEAAR